jgi:hypothetical protein
MEKNRSIFWPLTLIATGALWLLISMGTIPATNLWALTYIWPYALIALGVGLILRTLWRPLGMLVSALVVIGAVAAVFYAPQLGWADAPTWGNWGNNNSFSGAVPGSGKIETETRKVSGFTGITIGYPVEIIIRQGAAESLSIEAEDNLLPQLTTEVRSGTLYIENKENRFAKRVDPSESVKITITVKTLNEIDFPSAGTLTVESLKGDSLKISLSGAGDIVLKNLELKSLEAHVSGAGKITASGSATKANVTISGLGDFDGSDLTCQEADADIPGAGSISLRVEKQLNATISGAGSVNYYGPASVSKSISGVGDVNKAGD